MNLDFSEVLRRLGVGAAFLIANAARPGGDLILSTLLPERNMPTYDVKSGNMTIRSTMAGLVGMDSPYPPTGAAEASTFNEQTAKVANEVVLSEQMQRHLQMMLQTLQGRGEVTQQTLQTEVLNFLNKGIVQPHLDTAEYLRARALVNGAIDWTFGNIRLQVDYGFDAASLMAQRTGTAAYDSTASVFWADVAEVNRLLKNQVLFRIAHPTTINAILNNPANDVRVISQVDGRVAIQRLVSRAGVLVPSDDAREVVTLIAYDAEGEILDPTTPGNTITIPFMPVGKILNIGRPGARGRGYRVGEGSTPDPNAALALGYTHIAPTIEGGGRMGRWADLDVPSSRPWQLRGRGVTNLLPVIENPDLVVVQNTTIS